MNTKETTNKNDFEKNLSEKWKDVLDFWFDPENAKYWFEKSSDFDEKIRKNFLDIWKLGCEGLLMEWRSTLKGILAEIIVLDQFSRNLCRDKACAFSQDKMALVLSQEAIRHPDFFDMMPEEKKFILMPFMHSESSEIHDIGILLFEKWTDADTIRYEHLHKDILIRFGRYPHRNKIIGRKSTFEEIEFLKQPGSSF